MRNGLRAFLVLLSCLALPLDARAAGRAGGEGEGIAVVVNEDAISMSDLNDRLKLVMVSSGLPNSPDVREKLIPQIVGVLIEEQLKFQEAARAGVDAAPEEIDQGFASIAAQNKFTPDQFKALLQRSGIEIGTMYRQIRSQIAWTKVVQQEVRPKINVSDADIDNVLERLQGNKGQTEYLLAEIFLPVESADKEQSAEKLARQLYGQIQAGQAPFFKVAQQFSQTAGASKGGDMGWIQAGQLPPALAAAVEGKGKDSLIEPVKSLTGYHILYVRDVRTITDETIPPREEVLNMVGTERLERLQRRLLLDLKSAAFIDNRVSS